MESKTTQLEFAFCERDESPADRKRRMDRERQAEKRLRNGDAVREYKRLCRARNIERYREAGRRKYHKHGDRNRQRARERYERDGQRIRDAARTSYAANREKRRAYHRAYYKAKGRLKARRPLSETQKQSQRDRRERWMAANRDHSRKYLRQYINRRMKTDPAFAEAQRQRQRVWQSLSRASAKKTSRTLDLIGCTAEELRAHIESQFCEGMSWSNRSEWHIDHIIPLACFDLKNTQTHAIAFHYTNLRPLWKRDNLSKGSKMPEAIPEQLLSRLGSFLINLGNRGPAIRHKNACRSDQKAMES